MQVRNMYNNWENYKNGYCFFLFFKLETCIGDQKSQQDFFLAFLFSHFFLPFLRLSICVLIHFSLFLLGISIWETTQLVFVRIFVVGMQCNMPRGEKTLRKQERELLILKRENLQLLFQSAWGGKITNIVEKYFSTNEHRTHVMCQIFFYMQC